MKRYQHLLVYLSLRDDDAAVLGWASRVAQMAQSSRVTLLHVWSPVDIPEALRKKYPWLVAPGEEIVLKRLEEMAAKYLRVGKEAQVERRIKEGNPLAEVLETTLRESVDLIVVNRDRRDAGLAEKLARKAPCSVLGVPDQAPVKLDHILAAFDFSEFSRSALEVAVAFSKPTEAKLSIIHSFEVPWGLHKTGVSREQLVTETKSFLGQELKRETASAVSGLNGHSHEVVESSLPEAALARAADEWKCDLVVIGCRGHGAIYATLLGSTAEAILRESPVPVLAVKPKGSGVPLLEQLRQAEH